MWEAFTTILAIFGSLLFLLVVYLKWLLRYWHRHGIPTPPISFPFGNSKSIFLQETTFGKNMKQAYFYMKAKGLKFCGYYFFVKPMLLILDLDLIKQILIKDFSNFTDRTLYVSEELDPLSGHLFALKGLKWRNLRVKLSPTFTSGKMKMMFPTLMACSDQLVAVIEDMVDAHEAVDIKETMGRFSTDVFGSCAFGIECNSLKNPDAEFRHYGKMFFDVDGIDSLKQFLSMSCPEVLYFLKQTYLRPELSKFFTTVVKETVNHREANNITRKDFLHLLIQLKNNVEIKDDDSVGELCSSNKELEVGKSLTMSELTAQAFVFFLGGFEGSSSTLTFCMFELVLNPDIQEKVRDEINTTLEKYDGKITYEAVMEMTYMDKCVKEALRKHPVVPVLFRECTSPYKFPDSDLVLPKGKMIFIPTLGIHHDPEFYPEPEKYDPERFSPENKAKRHPCAYLPFGGGPRTCIGYRFGLMQAKTALTVLLRRYRFSVNPKTQLPIIMDPKSFVQTAEGGIWLDVEKLGS